VRDFLATANLNIADHVHLFMTTVLLMNIQYFQQDNACHKAQIISNWFLEHDSEFTKLKQPPQSADFQSNRGTLGCGGKGDSHQLTNLLQLCDYIVI